MADDYETTRWCPCCEKETIQIAHSEGHERDSSLDYYECTVCHKRAYGITGFEDYR